MPTTKRDLQALHYLAQRLREETMGAGEWHDNGLTTVLAKMQGHNLAITIERVTRHAADPEARTPAAIERPFVPEAAKPEPRQPAKAGSGDECRRHPGEHATGCRACTADRIAGEPGPTVINREKPPVEVAHRGAAACRAAAGLPDPSPAHGAPTPSEPPAPPVPSRADEGDDHGPASAGESDRPETACVAPGCYRPTTDGICDRCRATAADEAMQAANVELVERLHANEAARARTRPEPDPSAPAPRYFTSADYDPERVHAAQAQRTDTYRAAKTALNGADHE